MSARVTARWARGAVLGVVALALSGCNGDAGAGNGPATSATPSPTEAPVVALEFDESGLDLTPGPAELTNSGQAELDAQVVTGSAGSLEAVPGRDDGTALRFPPYAAGVAPRLAVLVIVPPEEDVLSPGEADFEFGLDFALDAESEGGVDNGNNLMQRGLFADPAQYKLQVEHGKLSCRIFGTAGEVLVKAEAPIETEVWYRTTCRRQGDEVVLSLRALEQPGEPLVGEWTETGPTGAVTMASSTSPLSIGGKVSDQGFVLPGNPDQFNGIIDNVRYQAE